MNFFSSCDSSLHIGQETYNANSYLSTCWWQYFLAFKHLRGRGIYVFRLSTHVCAIPYVLFVMPMWHTSTCVDYWLLYVFWICALLWWKREQWLMVQKNNSSKCSLEIINPSQWIRNELSFYKKNVWCSVWYIGALNVQRSNVNVTSLSNMAKQQFKSAYRFLSDIKSQFLGCL